MYLLTHSLAYSLTHSLTHVLTHSLTCLLTNPLTCLLTHLLTHLLTYLLTHVLTHSCAHLGTTNNAQSKLLADLNIPLTYAHMAEYSNVMIPMDPTNILQANDGNRMITTALTMASAIDTYSSYQYLPGTSSAKQLSSVHEWSLTHSDVGVPACHLLLC